MTLLYRERLRTRRPPEMVAAAITRSLDADPERSDGDQAGDSPPDGERRWTVDRAAGLYRHEVRLAPVDGEVVLSVTGPSWFAPLSVLVLALAVGAAAASVAGPGVPAWALLATLWAGTALALVPVVHLWPATPVAGPDLNDAAETVGRRLSAVAVPPFLAVVVACWTALRAAGVGTVAHGAAVVFLLVGGGVYYAANALSSGTTDGGVPAVGVALSALSPALVAAGNLVVLGGLVGGPPPERVDLAVAVGFSLATFAVFLLYCRVALRTFDRARFVHVRSRVRRVVGVALVGAVNGALLAGVAAVGVVLAVDGLGMATPAEELGRFYPEYAAATGAVAPLPSPLPGVVAVGAYAVAVAPVLAVVVGWLRYLASGLRLRAVVLWRSDPFDPAGDLDVAVRLVDVGVPVVRPVVVGPKRFVVADRSVVETLTDDELAAVLAHESYHLERRGPAARLSTGLASLVVGGPNVLVAFHDYPAIERAADDRAVELVGADALVRALRRLERSRLERGVGDTDPSLLGAPARLFFGSVLLDRAHGGVDERIERITSPGD